MELLVFLVSQKVLTYYSKSTHYPDKIFISHGITRTKALPSKTLAALLQDMCLNYVYVKFLTEADIGKEP